MDGKDTRTRWKTYGKSRSLRLQGFDYSSPRLYFLTTAQEKVKAPSPIVTYAKALKGS